ncbi:MAG: response regulator [Ramlibacter sp.]
MAARKKILLVDDDSIIVNLLTHRLSGLYEVSATTNPRAALRMARSQPPDLVLCDIDMPGMSGGDLAYALSREPGLAQVPILYLTAIVSLDEVHDLDGMLGGRPGVSKQAPLPELISRIDALTQ